jgi:tetratricopeptide (TPR) repeat protein
MAAFDTSESGTPGAATPWFARVAATLLESGNSAEALRICIAGTRIFPRYATGRLILGKCYDALGRHLEAMLEYRRVIEVFPDNPVISELYTNAKERDAQGFAHFCVEQEAKLHGRKDRLTFDDYVGAADSSRFTSVERIIKQLEEAPRRIPPLPEPAPAPVVEQAESPGRFVTATLAEIYASQGEYGEAIEAYRKLAEQRPGSAERYQRRLKELEELLRSREGDRTE